MNTNQYFRKRLREGYIPVPKEYMLSEFSYINGIDYNMIHLHSDEFKRWFHSLCFLRPLVTLQNELSASDLRIAVKIIFNWSINNFCKDNNSPIPWCDSLVAARFVIFEKVSALINEPDWLVDTLKDHYKFMKKKAEGDFAVVWLAKHKRFDI